MDPLVDISSRVRGLRPPATVSIDERATRSSTPDAWTSQALAEDALPSDERVAEALVGLEKSGLARRASDGSRLSPARLDLAGVQRLRAILKVDRARVTNAFFACKLAALRVFADSFRNKRSG